MSENPTTPHALLGGNVAQRAHDLGIRPAEREHEPTAVDNGAVGNAIEVAERRDDGAAVLGDERVVDVEALLERLDFGAGLA